MTWEPEVREIERRKQLAYKMGGEERIQNQRDRGKLTVRERIEALVDAGSFREHGVLAGSAEYDGAELKEFRSSAFVMGRAKLDGRPVVVGGGDITARARPQAGGRGGNKSGQSEEMAFELKIPMVRLIDGFGADIRAIGSISRTYIPANPNFSLVAAMMG